MAPHADGTMGAPTFSGGLQGGFLLQTNSGAVTGNILYSVTSSQNPGTPCSNGTAAMSGTITGTIGNQMVTLTAVAGTETINLAGTLSPDGSTMTGNYTPSGNTCGYAETSPTTPLWTAIAVPPLTGPIQGSFHSTGGAAGLNEQDFLVSGALNQATNTGAATAAVTGNLNFVNTTTDLTQYPCFAFASVNGQISGSSVTLQITGPGQAELGLIGVTVGSDGVTSTNLSPVNFAQTNGGYVLSGVGPTYLVSTAAGTPPTPCPGALGNTSSAGDYGTICFALNSTTGCPQPITLTPSALIFSTQPVNSPPTLQTITLANNYGSVLGGLTLALSNSCPGSNSCLSNFTETDTCGVGGIPSQGQAFTLASKQSCVVTIMFSPLQECAAGTVTDQCLAATLAVTSPNNNAIFTAPITGGASPVVASIRGFDFHLEPVTLASFPLLPKVANPSAPRRSTFLRAVTSQDVEHHAEID